MAYRTVMPDCVAAFLIGHRRDVASGVFALGMNVISGAALGSLPVQINRKRQLNPPKQWSGQVRLADLHARRSIGHKGRTPAIRCARHGQPHCGTIRPFAGAARASAEIIRACGIGISAARRISPDRTFDPIVTGRIQTALSLQLESRRGLCRPSTS